MEYLILWFDVDGEMVGTNCTLKDLRKGVVELKLQDNESKSYYSIGYQPIQNCIYISKFRYLNSDKKFVKWEDRNILFERYPKLKKLVA